MPPAAVPRNGSNPLQAADGAQPPRAGDRNHQDPRRAPLANGGNGVTAESVAERPGWQDMTAVVNGTVLEMDDDVASRWGPRIVDYMLQVAEAVVGVRELDPAG